MKERTQTNVVLRSSLALALALAIWSPVQARSAGPVEGKDVTEGDAPVGHEKEVVVKGFVRDIENLTIKNNEFRQVLYTAKHSQLVLMALKPKE